MSDNKRNSKYRHPRYYVIGLEGNPVAPLLTHSLTAQPSTICPFPLIILCRGVSTPLVVKATI